MFAVYADDGRHDRRSSPKKRKPQEKGKKFCVFQVHITV